MCFQRNWTAATKCLQDKHKNRVSWRSGALPAPLIHPNHALLPGPSQPLSRNVNLTRVDGVDWPKLWQASSASKAAPGHVLIGEEIRAFSCCFPYWFWVLHGFAPWHTCASDTVSGREPGQLQASTIDTAMRNWPGSSLPSASRLIMKIMSFSVLFKFFFLSHVFCCDSGHHRHTALIWTRRTVEEDRERQNRWVLCNQDLSYDTFLPRKSRREYDYQTSFERETQHKAAKLAFSRSPWRLIFLSIFFFRIVLPFSMIQHWFTHLQHFLQMRTHVYEMHIHTYTHTHTHTHSSPATSQSSRPRLHSQREHVTWNMILAHVTRTFMPVWQKVHIYNGRRWDISMYM